jgi:acyl carrier protein
MTRPRLEFEAFIEEVRREFSIVGEVQPNSLLVEELALDSLDLINLVAFSEELSHQLRTDAEFPVLVTVSDAYSYYLSLLESESCQLK